MGYIVGDIHTIIKTLPSNSVDFIYTDPPFGITNADWDVGLDWMSLWDDMWRVLKPKGTICLYASMPFTYELLRYQKPKYHYTWIKDNTTGFLTAKTQPLRQCEEIFIYYKRPPTYNPQMLGDDVRTTSVNDHTGGSGYYKNKNKSKRTVSDYEGETEHHGAYPTTCFHSPIRRDGTGISRTDDHIDRFIKTYTNLGETVLDMTCHNYTVGNRCKALGRRYIGIDLKCPSTASD